MMSPAPEASYPVLRIKTSTGNEISFSQINTTNKKKLGEFQEAGLHLAPCSVEIDELQPSDHINQLIARGHFREASQLIAEDKAFRAFQKLGQPVLIEDTSMYVVAAPNVTGPLIKQWLQTAEGLNQLSQLANNANNNEAVAYFILAVANETERSSWIVEIPGNISSSPQGENGFGWDPIFVPEPRLQTEILGTNKTYAELSPNEILKIAPRRLRVATLLKKSVLA